MAGERIIPGGAALEAFHTLGSDNWDTDWNTNLLKVAGGLTSVLVVKSQVTTLPGSPVLGDIYIVKDGDANEKKIAIWDGPLASEVWTYFPAFEGLTAYPIDTKLEILFDGTDWVNNSPGAAPTLLGTLDFSVNNVTATEDVTRQITGMADYKFIHGTISGLDPAEGTAVRLRLMKPGETLGVEDIFEGMYQYAASTRYGMTLQDWVLLTHLSGGTNAAHFDISNHWNDVIPTRVDAHFYDDDISGSDSVGDSSMWTNTVEVYDGISLRTSTGDVVLGILKLYGYG